MFARFTSWQGYATESGRLVGTLADGMRDKGRRQGCLGVRILSMEQRGRILEGVAGSGPF